MTMIKGYKLESILMDELLNAVMTQFNLESTQEAGDNIAANKYTKDEIINAIAKDRIEGLVPKEVVKTYLPTVIDGIIEDYRELFA